jgi:hypothetical protein
MTAFNTVMKMALRAGPVYAHWVIINTSSMEPVMKVRYEKEHRSLARWMNLLINVFLWLATLRAELV